MTKLMSICQAAAVILFCAAVPAGAASGPFSADDLDQLLRPIALYPDPLLAEILTAATVPAQIVLADRYVNDGGDPGQIEEQPWDPSVQALAHYPTVLKWLDDNLPWTTEVGEAFLDQQPDVMASVQHLRLLAQGAGNLQSTPQEYVVNDGGTVEIVPANPEVIYVPVYPWNTIYYDPGIFCSFGVGFPIGIWLRHDWDWRNHHVVVWGPGHSRPANWWSQPPRNRVAPGGVAIWHAPPHASARGGARGADRGFDAQAFRPARPAAPSAPGTPTANRPANPPQASRGGTVPGSSSGLSIGATPPITGRPPPTVNPSTGARPSPGVGTPGSSATPPITGRPPPIVIPSTGTRPSPGAGSSGSFAVPPMTGRPPPVVVPSTGRAPSAGGFPPIISRPAPSAPAPSVGASSSGGAFGGSESASQTRQSSVRGVQSRSTMSPPASAPSSAPTRSYSAPASAPASQPSHSSGSSGSGGSSGSSRGR